jgi:hypothetical protein
MKARTRRLVTTLLAPGAALLAWSAFRLLDVDFVLKSGDEVGAVDVIIAAVAGSIGGWLVLRLIERRTERPRATWSLVSSTALAVSVIGPTWLADGSTAVALITLHVVTAAVVIGGFAGTVRPRRFSAAPAAGDANPASAR